MDACMHVCMWIYIYMHITDWHRCHCNNYLSTIYFLTMRVVDNILVTSLLLSIFWILNSNRILNLEVIKRQRTTVSNICTYIYIHIRCWAWWFYYMTFGIMIIMIGLIVNMHSSLLYLKCDLHECFLMDMLQCSIISTIITLIIAMAVRLLLSE